MDRTMVEDWEKLDSEPLANYRIFQTRKDTRRSPRTGNIHQFYVLESSDWVNVIPLTADNNVVLIHQYRHGREKITLEIPGGIVDPEDDSPAETARRELLEETGYEVDHLVHIGTVDPNPAFLNNRCYTYLALGARKTQEPTFDGAEDIAVVEIPLDNIPELIRNGRISHALVVAAFYHYENFVSDDR
jgi:8-oxo-dGTP pyrophosphatase MutT (NUDIX family)